MEPDGLSGLRGVSKIHISDSHFGRVGKHAFADLTHIDDFKIGSCSFRSFSQEAFRNMKDIGSFQMFKNNITLLGKNAFVGAFKLGSVSVYSNFIKTVDNGTFEYLAEAADTMVMNDNVFECSCDLTWLVNSDRMLEYLRENTCVYPGHNPNSESFHLSAMYEATLCKTQTPPSIETSINLDFGGGFDFGSGYSEIIDFEDALFLNHFGDSVDHQLKLPETTMNTKDTTGLQFAVKSSSNSPITTPTTPNQQNTGSTRTFKNAARQHEQSGSLFLNKLLSSTTTTNTVPLSSAETLDNHSSIKPESSSLTYTGLSDVSSTSSSIDSGSSDTSTASSLNYSESSDNPTTSSSIYYGSSDSSTPSSSIHSGLSDSSTTSSSIHSGLSDSSTTSFFIISGSEYTYSPPLLNSDFHTSTQSPSPPVQSEYPLHVSTLLSTISPSPEPRSPTNHIISKSSRTTSSESTPLVSELSEDTSTMARIEMSTVMPTLNVEESETDNDHSSSDTPPPSPTQNEFLHNSQYHSSNSDTTGQPSSLPSSTVSLSTSSATPPSTSKQPQSSPSQSSSSHVPFIQDSSQTSAPEYSSPTALNSTSSPPVNSTLPAPPSSTSPPLVLTNSHSQTTPEEALVLFDRNEPSKDDVIPDEVTRVDHIIIYHRDQTTLTDSRSDPDSGLSEEEVQQNSLEDEDEPRFRAYASAVGMNDTVGNSSTKLCRPIDLSFVILSIMFLFILNIS